VIPEAEIGKYRIDRNVVIQKILFQS